MSQDAPPPGGYGQAPPSAYSHVPPPTAPGYGPPAAYPPAYPYPYPPAHAYAPPLPKHPGATPALVAGILGLTLGLLCLGIGFLASPFAWVIGHRAVRDVDAHPDTWSGRGAAHAGRVTGIIGTVTLGIVLVLAVLGVVGLATS